MLPTETDEIVRLAGLSTTLEQVASLSKCNRCVLYREIQDMTHYSQIFGGGNCAIVLIETDVGSGHWVAMIDRAEAIEFFDSYGFAVDDQLKFIPLADKKKLGGDYAHLTKLLYASKRPVVYNDHAFQSQADDIGTCGLWVSCRLLFKAKTIEEFTQLFENVSDYDIVRLCYDFTL